jgi:DHA1 family tetracycline resistance protein-like MFS transporter
MTPPASGRRAVFIVFATVLIDTIGFGIIIPVMPELLRELTGSDLAGAAAWHGAIYFSFAFAQFFCAPILGNLSDRYGRRPVILCSLLAFGIDYLIMGFANWIGWLFLGRIVAGIAGASYTPAYAFIADVSPPEKRAANFGLMGAAFGAGFIIGPAVGGLLGSLGPRAPFFVAGGLALLNASCAWFLLPETLAPGARRHFQWSRANPLGALLHVRRFPLLPGLLAVHFLWQLAMQVYPSTWSFFTMLRFDWSTAAVGASLAFVGVIMVIAQGGLTRVLIPLFGGERPSALIGMIAGSMSFVAYAFATQGWMMYAGMLIWFVAALAYPSLNALMSQQAPANAQGELQGAAASLASLSAIIGPPLLTQILAHFSSEAARVHFPGAAFLTAAMLGAASAMLFARATRAVAAVERGPPDAPADAAVAKATPDVPVDAGGSEPARDARVDAK